MSCHMSNKKKKKKIDNDRMAPLAISKSIELLSNIEFFFVVKHTIIREKKEKEKEKLHLIFFERKKKQKERKTVGTVAYLNKQHGHVT